MGTFLSELCIAAASAAGCHTEPSRAAEIRAWQGGSVFAWDERVEGKAMGDDDSSSRRGSASDTSVVLMQEDTARWRSSGLHRAPTPDVVAVDDDTDALELILLALSGEGMRVRGCSRVEEALALISERAPDVLVLDLCLGGERGEDLARRLRNDPSHASMRLIAVTGAAVPEWERVRSFDAYLRKPVEMSLIVALIRQLSAARQETP